MDLREFRAIREHSSERCIEDLDREVDLVLGDRQRRCHPEAVRARAGADDVHRKSSLEALRGYGRAERVRGETAVAVLDELDPHEQPAPAYVADLLVRPLKLAQTLEQVLASLTRAFDQPLLLDDLEHCETGSRR